MRQKDIEARFGRQYQLPVFYFTQLLGLAMAARRRSFRSEAWWWSRKNCWRPRGSGAEARP